MAPPTRPRRLLQSDVALGSLFALLPWAGVASVELMQGTPAWLYVVDPTMRRLALMVFGVYLLVVGVETAVGSLFVRASERFGGDRRDSRALFFVTLGLLGPATYLVAHELVPACSRSCKSWPVWVLVPMVVVTAASILGVATLITRVIPSRLAREGVVSLLILGGLLVWTAVLWPPPVPGADAGRQVEPWVLLGSSAVIVLVLLGQGLVLWRLTRPDGRPSPGPARLGSWLGALLIACVLALPAAGWLLGPSKRANGSSPATGPNVVMLLVDTVRADHLPFTQYSRDTLSLGFAALGRPVTLFSEAITQASATVPAVKALFTSRPASSWGVESFARPPPRDAWTLPRAFQEAGYHTAGFSTNGLIKEGFASGFDLLISWSGLLVSMRSVAVSRFLCAGDRDEIFRFARSTRTHYADGSTIVRLVEDWLADLGHTPFFLYLHTVDPHWPYYEHGFGFADAAAGSDLSYVDLLEVADGEARAIRESAAFRDLVGRYDEELRHTDRLVRELLQVLSAHDSFGNTIFVLLADHGEEFLEHGRFSHGHDVWEELIHVPLAIVWPEGELYSKMPSEVRHRVRLVDLLPTLTDYLDLPAGDAPVSGSSMRPLLEKTRDDEAWLPGLAEGLVLDASRLRVAYWEGRTKVRMTVDATASPRRISDVAVFDLASDPAERRPLPAERAETAGLVLRARRHLEAAWGERVEHRPRGPQPGQETKSDTADDARMQQLKALGYID